MKVSTYTNSTMFNQEESHNQILYLNQKESQLIWQIHLLLYRSFKRVFSVYCQALMMKKLS